MKAGDSVHHGPTGEDWVVAAVAERATETRFAGWRHDCCKWCGEPRMALDIEMAREVARGHAGTCLGQRKTAVTTTQETNR